MARYERLIFRYQEHIAYVEAGFQAAHADKIPEKTQDDVPPAGVFPERSLSLNETGSVNLEHALTETVVQIFDMMLSMALEVADEGSDSSMQETPVVASVSFAGDLMGIVSIYVSEAFAREIAAAMMGIEAEEIEADEEINDVLGELSNIIGGNLKTAFSAAGFFSELSPPSITRGSDFKIEALNMAAHQRVVFRYEEKVIFVEAGLQSAVQQGFSSTESASGDQDDAEALEASDKTLLDPSMPQDASSNFEEVPEIDIQEKNEHPEGLPFGPDHPEATESPERHGEADSRAQEADAGGVESPREPKSSSQFEGKSHVEKNLEFILDIPLELSVEIGRTKKTIQELLKIGTGSILDLANLEDEPVNILVNDMLVARGAVLVEKERYGIRIVEIINRLDRIKSLK
jgi:flagellar motor switch protein FliN